MQIVPFKVLFKSRSEHVDLNAQCDDPQSASSMLTDSVSDINIWYAYDMPMFCEFLSLYNR